MAGVSLPLARFRLAALAFVAVFAFLGCFAGDLALLAGFGAAVAASAAPLPSRLWIAFQIRLTADFRSVNFLTGLRPGIPFQTSISRLAGHLAARSASSCWLANISPSKSACWLPRALMLFSASIRNVAIVSLLLTAVAVTTFITLFPNTSKTNLKEIDIGEGRAMRP